MVVTLIVPNCVCVCVCVYMCIHFYYSLFLIYSVLVALFIFGLPTPVLSCQFPCQILL